MKIVKILRRLGRAFYRTFSPKVPFISFASIDSKRTDGHANFRQNKAQSRIFEVNEVCEANSSTDGYALVLEEPSKGLQFKHTQGFTTRCIHRVAVNDDIDALEQVESEDLEDDSIQSEICSSTSSEEFLLLT